ncbi:MAG: acetyltransferase [Desulfobacteraceae bacterium]|nr:acetyltransferase [Desulfobacteraceae bacterium]
MPKKLLLFPFGGNAREALLSVFAMNGRNTEWEVLGFIDDDQSRHGNECCGIKVLGGREILNETPDAFVLAVPGSPTSYPKRNKVIGSLNLDESRFATIIHPSVVVSPDAKIGYNTVIMPNAVISCGVTIGNHCIILPNTVISHDSIVGDYSCFGSNISISGSVRIGSSCYVGSGTKMRENVSIGDRTLVGLGSNVITNIEADVVAAGSPAKTIRKYSLQTTDVG